MHQVFKKIKMSFKLFKGKTYSFSLNKKRKKGLPEQNKKIELLKDRDQIRAIYFTKQRKGDFQKADSECLNDIKNEQQQSVNFLVAAESEEYCNYC